MVAPIILFFLFILPFMDGGLSLWAKFFLLVVPLPVFLLGWWRRELRWENLFRAPVIFLLLFLVFLSVSTLVSTSWLFSVPAYFVYLALGLWTLLFNLVFDRSWLRRLVVILFIPAGTLLSLVAYWYLLPFVPKPPAGMNLVYASYGHSHVVDYLFLSLPLTLGFLGERKITGRGRWLLWFLLALQAGALVLSFSRGAFLVLALISVALMITQPWAKAIRRRFLVAGGTLLLLLLVVIPVLGSLVREQSKEDWLARQVVKTDLTGRRPHYWGVAVASYLERPLWGQGPGTFEMAMLQRSVDGTWSAYAHNHFLQILSETGIFGLGAFLLFLWAHFRTSLKKANGTRPPLVLAGWVALTASILHAMIDYDWSFPAVFLTVTLLLTVLGGSQPPGRQKPSVPWVVAGLLILATVPFLFGISLLGSEFLALQKDHRAALQIAPWPPVRFRSLGDKILAKDKDRVWELEKRFGFLVGSDPSTHRWFGDRFLAVGEKSRALDHYSLAVAGSPFANQFLYPIMGRLYGISRQDEKRWALYRDFRQKLAAQQSVAGAGRNLGQTAYWIGNDYVFAGQPKEALFWWEKAVLWLPEWSHVYLELASLKRQLGDEPGVAQVFADCQKFRHPAKHCASYRHKTLPEPGSWRQKIAEIPQKY